MSACLFVQADGTISQRDLPGNAAARPDYLVPRCPPLRWVADDHAAAHSPMLAKRFVRRGETFNGQAIFCEPHYVVKEARMSLLVRDRPDDIARADGELLREVRALAARDHWAAIELESVVTTVARDAAQHIVTRGVRLLVAVIPKSAVR